MLGSACDCANECILNLLKAFYLGGGQCVINGFAVVESCMIKSSGNGGGSTVFNSVAHAPKITWQALEREEICVEKERVESKMKPRFLAKGVGEIGCALIERAEG